MNNEKMLKTFQEVEEALERGVPFDQYRGELVKIRSWIRKNSIGDPVVLDKCNKILSKLIRLKEKQDASNN